MPDSSSQAAQIVEHWTKNHLGHEVEQLDTLRFFIADALTLAHQQGRVEVFKEADERIKCLE